MHPCRDALAAQVAEEAAKAKEAQQALEIEKAQVRSSI